MATTRVQDFYKATITRNWTATTGDFNVSVAPTITAGIIVISPNSTTQREIVRYTATGTNQYGPFVTISDVADRGLSGTTAQSHIIGEQVRMNVTAVHWDELLADAVAPTVDIGTTTTLEPGSDATATNSGTTIDAILDFGIPAGSTIYSGTSIPDNSVGRNGDWAFDTSVNCYVWYKSGGTWALVNSLKGATGDGNGIASITKTGTVGLVDTYTITYDDATTSTFDITNGAKGDTGDAGVSVVSIIKTDTVGLVDTYTITYSNSTTSTFDVTNGQDGTNGLDGTDGIDGIDGISFTPKGAYNALTEYIANDVVSYLGSTWIALQTTTGNTPEEGVYWTLNAAKGTDGAGSGDVLGPATNTANYIPQWDGANSKTLKDGLGLDTDLSSVSANDDTVPSAKATKTYADGKVEDAIVDGVTTKAPSQNAVFDALALKDTKTDLTKYSNLNAPEGFLINGKIVPSVASNNLTVAIKGLDGNDPSASNPVYCRIGDAIRTITSALSVTKNAGTNWFNAGSAELATKEIDYFVYLGYNATDGVVIGFSRIPYATLYSDFSATSTNEKYAGISTITNAVAGDNYRNIGRFAAILSAGAGYTWTVPTFTSDNLIQRPIFETRWLTWNPVYTASGSMTFTSVNTTTSKYKANGRQLHISINANGTVGGTLSITLTASMPFRLSPSGDVRAIVYVYDAGLNNRTGWSVVNNGSFIGFSLATTQNWSAGAGREISTNQIFEY